LAEEAVDTFIVNLRFVGLLQTLSGAERIVTVEHLLDSLPSSPRQASALPGGIVSLPHNGKSSSLITAEQANFESMCFYVTPIGEDDSEQRRHSDLFLGSIVEPAL